MIINIEVCGNCKQHQWCTRHQEEKYKKYYQRVKTAIKALELHAKYAVVKNRGVIVPAMGAFEVRVGDCLIFSKVLQGRWPDVARLAETIKSIDQQQMAGEDWQRQYCIVSCEEGRQYIEQRQPRSTNSAFGGGNPNSTKRSNNVGYTNNVPKYNL